jgi:NAD+ synthase
MEFCTDYEIMFSNIVAQGIKYINKYPDIHTLIVGVSGGIDSTLTAAIAREICDRTGRLLICVSIPIETNTKDEIERARLTGVAFADELIEVKFIDRMYRFCKLMVKLPWYSTPYFNIPNEKIRQGNIKARLRMIYLYDKAHRENGIVLSTDNLTEHYLNFFTLHGDVGDLGLIQNLWKTEVYGLSKWLSNTFYRGMPSVALKRAKQAIPTDGLGITASDFEQLGADNYYDVDKILLEEVQANAGFVKSDEHHTHPVVQRCRRYAFKRHNPFNIARDLIVPGNAPIIDKL